MLHSHVGLVVTTPSSAVCFAYIVILLPLPSFRIRYGFNAPSNLSKHLPIGFEVSTLSPCPPRRPWDEKIRARRGQTFPRVGRDDKSRRSLRDDRSGREFQLPTREFSSFVCRCGRHLLTVQGRRYLTLERPHGGERKERPKKAGCIVFFFSFSAFTVV